MKSETAIITVRILCSFIVAMAISLGGQLAQWSNSEVGPSRIQWTIILIAAIGQGAKDLSAYLSSAWSSYKQSQSNGNGKPSADTAKPV